MKITYYVHDLHFPLREGIRKQAWWLAQAMQREGYSVEILSTSSKIKVGTILHEGITITYIKPWRLKKINADLVHYLIHPTPMMVPFLLFAKARAQYLTIHDGELNHFWKRIWWPLLSSIINAKIRNITVQTEHQLSLLHKTSLKVPATKVDPLLSPQHLLRKCKKNKIPTLLFMSHLHNSKGIKEVLKAFSLVREKIPIQLVIADSGITKNEEIYLLIQKINRGDIVIKNIVNPEEELSNAWIYLYPVNTARETFSIPLSLIEAIQIGTPYISTTVGGIPEFFDSRTLVAPYNHQQLAEKILELIEKPKVYPLNKQIKNEEVIKEHLQLYSSD